MATAGDGVTGESVATAATSSALDHLREGFAIFDRQLHLRACNARFATLAGYRPGLCRPGISAADLARDSAARGDLAGNGIEVAVDAHLARLGGREAVSFEQHRADGTVLSVTITPLSDSGVLLSCLDITGHVAAERALRQSDEMLRVVTDEAPVMLNIIDVDRQQIYANRRNAEFLGRPPEELLGHGWESFIHPDDLAWLLEEEDEAFREPRDHELVYRLRRHDGVYRWMREIFVARFAADGAFLGFVSAIEDVSEARAAQEELARQREALHHSEKLAALGSLLAGVAHELNNPLALLLGHAQLLQETAPDAPTAARADKIVAAAERCAKIVKTFLAMARSRPAERSATNLNAIVEASLDMLGYSLRSAGIEVALDLAPDLPSTWADGSLLQEVVTNLVVNAEQAMAGLQGPRRLRIATGFDPAAGQLRLDVEDSGPGVPPAIRSRIFEPFFTTKSFGVGTGIGLSLCHGIVESHGGTIAVEDAEGGGARFVVRLPRGQAGPPAAEPAAAEVPASPVPPRPILIVDDEIAIAEMLAEILTGAGHSVEIATSGKAALDCIDRRRYDLVVSDLRMPDLDGPGLYQALRERDPGWPERMVFVTGDALSAAAGAFLDRTWRPCIEKPFDTGEVRRVVAEVLAAADEWTAGGRPHSPSGTNM
jgi:PAS domain S-box-containing protein